MTDTYVSNADLIEAAAEPVVTVTRRGRLIHVVVGSQAVDLSPETMLAISRRGDDPLGRVWRVEANGAELRMTDAEYDLFGTKLQEAMP